MRERDRMTIERFCPGPPRWECPWRPGRVRGGFVMMEIVALPKERWKGTVIPLAVRSDSWYGFDTCCYTNNDIARREVRINLGFFFHREGRRS